MRTTLDLIDELHSEAADALWAWLIVGFEGSTIYVHSDDPGALQLLNDSVQEGGRPVGIVRWKNEGKRSVMTIRPLAEFADDELISKYCQSLGNSVLQQLRELHEGKDHRSNP